MTSLGPNQFGFKPVWNQTSWLVWDFPSIHFGDPQRVLNVWVPDVPVLIVWVLNVGEPSGGSGKSDYSGESCNYGNSDNSGDSDELIRPSTTMQILHFNYLCI